MDYYPAVFSQYFLTLFSYNTPIEYANRVVDLFWIYEEKIILDCLIHILKLNKDRILLMEIEVKYYNLSLFFQLKQDLIHFIRDDIVTDTIEEHGMQASLPFYK